MGCHLHGMSHHNCALRDKTLLFQATSGLESPATMKEQRVQGVAEMMQFHASNYHNLLRFGALSVPLTHHLHLLVPQLIHRCPTAMQGALLCTTDQGSSSQVDQHVTGLQERLKQSTTACARVVPCLMPCILSQEIRIRAASSWVWLYMISPPHMLLTQPPSGRKPKHEATSTTDYRHKRAAALIN
jgi:hypothetical protein